MSAPSKTSPARAAKETIADSVAVDDRDAIAADTRVDDLQAQIDGLHTRIDEAQQENAGALSTILEAVNTAKAHAEAIQAQAEPVEEAVQVEVLEELPEGTTRFFSPLASDYQVQWKPKRYITVGDEHQIIPPRFARFSNHVLTTDDAEEIDALRKLCEKPNFHDFVEDPLAKPQSRVKVIDGATDTGNRSQRHVGGLTPARI